MRELVQRQGPGPSTCALVLAGGAGRRAGGQDKGLLYGQGKRLVEHVIARIQPQVDAVYISCNRNRQIYSGFAELTQADLRPDYQGPLAGLEAARAQMLRYEYMLLAPCDMPLLPLDMVSRLLAGLNANADSKISYASASGFGQYLCAIMRVSYLDTLPAFLDTGQRSVRHWYQQTDATTVHFDERPEDFLNVNELTL